MESTSTGNPSPTNPLLNPNIPAVPKPTGPRVDDQFWFDWSYDYITNSLDGIDKNIASIDKLVLWAYGVYTTSTIIALAVKQITDVNIIAFMALPFLFLIVSYWLTNARLIEEDASLVYNIPDKIIEAYKVVYKKKSANLKITKICSFLGIFFMAVTFMIAFIYSNRKSEADPSFTARIIVNPKNTREIAITGRFPKSTNLYFTVTRHKKSTKPDSSKTIYFSHSNTTTGDYMTSVPLHYSVPDSAHRYTIRVEWNDSLYTRGLQRTILITQPTPSKPTQSTITLPGMTTVTK